VWKHRGAVFERGAAGRLGRRGIPYLLLFQVTLPMLGPFVDLATSLAYWLVFLLMQVCRSAVCRSSAPAMAVALTLREHRGAGATERGPVR
jgi:hypothetical protein